MFEFDGSQYTLAGMLASNAHDEDFCAWARHAAVGDAFCGCTRVLNITPTRLMALEYLASKPGGVYVCALADELLTSEYRLQIKSGFSRQQATRSGAGVAVPLIKAGLVSKRATTYGWGVVTITDAGLKTVAAHKAANNPINQPLDAVLERCIEN